MIIDKDWLAANSKYWDKASEIYSSLYNTKWSRLEDAVISKKLNKFIANKQGAILDLGFGLGLGYEFIQKNKSLIYYGIDISQGMLERCSLKFPDIHLSKGVMSDLTGYENEKFEVVMSIFSSFSYTDDVTQTLHEIKRVLKPDGVVLISVLGRFSLRRMFKSLFERVEKFRTRGSEFRQYSNAWTFTVSELKYTFDVVGFVNIKVVGLNALSGVNEKPLLWKLGSLISRMFPNLSHELIVTSKLS